MVPSDALAHRAFPKSRWPHIASTNPLERLNAEIKDAPTSLTSSTVGENPAGCSVASRGLAQLVTEAIERGR